MEPVCANRVNKSQIATVVYLTQINPGHALTYDLKIVLILYSSLRLDVPSDFPSGFSTKIL